MTALSAAVWGVVKAGGSSVVAPLVAVAFGILHGGGNGFVDVEAGVVTFPGLVDGDGGAAVAIFLGQGFGTFAASADAEAGVLVSLGGLEGGSLFILSLVGGAAFLGPEVDPPPCGCPVVKSPTTINKIEHCS